MLGENHVAASHGRIPCHKQAGAQHLQCLLTLRLHRQLLCVFVLNVAIVDFTTTRCCRFFSGGCVIIFITFFNQNSV